MYANAIVEKVSLYGKESKDNYMLMQYLLGAGDWLYDFTNNQKLEVNIDNMNGYLLNNMIYQEHIIYQNLNELLSDY